MTRDECIDVACLALPSGEVLWFPQSEGEEYLRAVLKKWEAEHPEFSGTPCTSGVVLITMPKEKYHAIGASFGPGCFEWPQR